MIKYILSIKTFQCLLCFWNKTNLLESMKGSIGKKRGWVCKKYTAEQKAVFKV